MRYNELTILIPSHSLEDFPTDLGEKPASSMLNAFAIAWHPVLLAEARVIPQWHRADEPPETRTDRLFVVPLASDEWIPSGWIAHSRNEGSVVVSGLSERAEMLEAALRPLRDRAAQAGEPAANPEAAEPTVAPPFPEVDPELAADFMALGTCYLHLELLTRHMHHFSNLDDAFLQREAVNAAQAACAGDKQACHAHLKTCFETLQEARERFYPVDCYLVDLCLLIPRLADEHLLKELERDVPMNFLISGRDLQEVAATRPDIVAAMKTAWDAKRIDVCGGELREGPTSILPIESVLWEFREGLKVYREALGRTPTTWGRRRFGFSSQVPQILKKSGFHSALHVAMDDGVYPDEEQSKIRWEGCDGTVVDAISRIPLAADSATSYLRFPQRMAESMEQDQVAALVFARWPEVKSPWFHDFRRINKYAPVLGKLITLHDFFDQTDHPGRLSSFGAQEYLTPYFIQDVARKCSQPVSQQIDHVSRRHRFEAAAFFAAAARVLCGQPVESAPEYEAERLIEEAAPDAEPAAGEKAETALRDYAAESAKALSRVILAGAPAGSGYLVMNSLGFSRRVSVDLPELAAAPAVEGPVKAVQFDEGRKSAVIELPPAGYVWVTAGGKTAGSRKSSDVPMAEDNVLRNDFFEVYISESTGGLRTIKGYGRSPNRLSQQLSFRFPRERTVTRGEGEEAESETTYYSEMRGQSSLITCNGPGMAEIVTTGDIVDQQNEKRLAGFRQTYRVWRARPVVEIDVELDVVRMPDENPWTSYFASRWAWNDSAAALTRSVLQGAQAFIGERFESPHFFEIAEGELRTTILTCGLPYHRKTGMRMLDSILVANGETRRKFRFVIAIDQDYPMQAALDAVTPPAVLPVSAGPPKPGISGWFFHLSARNVQLLRILDLAQERPESIEPWEQHDRPAVGPGKGFAVRLLETEGRRRNVKLHCFRTPSQARQRDFQGRTITNLNIENDAVSIELTAYEIADIELRFEG